MTDVQICNLALARIGGPRIVTIGESTVAGEACDLFYANTYDMALRAHDWKCAIKRASLAQNATAPIFGWDYGYALPPDCLRVIEMNKQDYGFDVEGRNLLTDETTAKIRYVSRVTTGTLDPLCVQSIYVHLAIELVIPIGKKADMKKELSEELEQRVLPEATKANAIEQLIPDYSKEQSSWMDARM